MKGRHAVMLAVCGALLAGTALAQEPGERQPMPLNVDTQAPRSSGGNIFYGGYVGLSFGSVNYVELSPMVGYRFSPSFGAGVGLLYRYREDDRYEQNTSLTDYGGNIFARYHIGYGVFAQAEYDYTNYEYVPNSFDDSTDRETYSALLAGLGFTTAVGRGAGFYALVLYDFNYSSSDPYQPYDSPVQYRFGVSFGF
jgi:hypothetical protein